MRLKIVKIRAQLSSPPRPSGNPLTPLALLSLLPPLWPRRVHGLLTWVRGSRVL